MKYQPTVGLEIHVELKTVTKMFCDCPNELAVSGGRSEDIKPNTNVCPVCMGHPGVLPVPNKKAIEFVIKVGLALGGKINPITKFDRKNYFYPDLPKAYQISQYDQPLVTGGELLGVRIHRIHLEEDTARLGHDTAGFSLVDFNRSGVPLMELVTEPDIHSAEQVAAFGRELQLILRYLEVSDANMEKGQLRVEPNISIAPVDSAMLGKKVEVKNINSFRAAQDASLYEFKRQEEILEAGGTVPQENRGWDDVKRITVSQRSKEDAHDYRYFPEPDIPPFETAIFDPEDMRRHLPELPKEKRERFMREYGLSDKQTEVVVQDRSLSDFFEAAVSELKEDIRTGSIPALYNYLASDFRGLLNETGTAFADIKINPESFADLVALLQEGRIMSRQAKDILRKMFETGEDARSIFEREEMATVSDEGALNATIAEVVAENAKAAQDYKAGKEASMQFLVGQAMRKLKGKANPETLKELFKKKLS